MSNKKVDKFVVMDLEAGSMRPCTKTDVHFSRCVVLLAILGSIGLLATKFF